MTAEKEPLQNDFNGNTSQFDLLSVFTVSRTEKT